MVITHKKVYKSLRKSDTISALCAREELVLESSVSVP